MKFKYLNYICQYFGMNFDESMISPDGKYVFDSSTNKRFYIHGGELNKTYIEFVGCIYEFERPVLSNGKEDIHLTKLSRS